MARLLLLVLFVGCATPPRAIRYDSMDFSVHIGTQGQVLKACNGVQRWDNGEKRTSGEKMTACFKPIQREIWLLDSCNGARALVHELAHLDGKYGIEADKIKW